MTNTTIPALHLVRRMVATRDADTAAREAVLFIAALPGVHSARIDRVHETEEATELVPLAEAGRRAPPGACASVFPIGTADGPPGQLVVKSAAPLDELRREFLTMLADILASLYATWDEVQRDTLTGLHNRRTFDGWFFGLQREPTPAGESHWLAIVDIDHFKRVNDCHGHLLGDEVLVVVARLLRTRIRASDRAFRFGGEEFALLIRDATPANALMVFERLRAAIEDQRIPQVGRVTASIGFTAIRPGEAPQDAFGRADAALYRAKETGRNRSIGHREAPEAIETEADATRMELFPPSDGD